MRTRLFGAALAASCLLLVLGCGSDDDGGGPNPVTGVDIAPDKAALEIGHSTGISATVTGGDNKNLTWFVNGVENGDEIYGTITQNSTVTYNAPDSLPSPRTVVIGAVSVEDTSKVDTCRVRVEFTKLFVDSATGNDDTANGCINLPYRTITRALPQATSGMTVLVRPGTYSDADGEFLPMHIYEGISLVGEDWEACIIKRAPDASGSYGILLSGNGAALRKFTIRQGGESRWRFPLLTDKEDGLIDSVRIFERGNTSCLRIDGAENVTVQNCVFNVEQDIMDTARGRGFEFTSDDQGCIIRNCRISGFGVALFMNEDSDVLVEDCHLINNVFGAELCCDNGVSNPNPDFGGGARGSTGGNNIWGNSECGLANYGGSTIYAKFNIWDNDPPIAGEDYCNESTGSIITE